MSKPDSIDILNYRKSVQKSHLLGITAAQDKCAEMLHTSRRAWQQWERGERTMHPAFWELAKIKNIIHKERD